ncbi:hypothetical protein ACU21_04040 [Actinobaculum suis]|nr:hypothetical protein ACU21_04040 [Actinobaculum suis]
MARGTGGSTASLSKIGKNRNWANSAETLPENREENVTGKPEGNVTGKPGNGSRLRKAAETEPG